MGKQKAVVEQAPVDIESVESLLEDLNLDAAETVELEAVEENVEDEVVQDMADEEIQDLELSLQKDELYSGQEASTEMDTNAPAEAEAAKQAAPVRKKKAAGTAAPKTPGVARTPRDLATVDAKFFVLEGDVASMDQATLDANKAAVLSTIPSQKKIAEKFENLFASLSVGKQPSVYVVQAFKLLDAKKSVTSADIVAAFKGAYAQGTAMSQSGQIMNLFATVKIATRTKNALVLNEDSAIAALIRTAIAKP